MPEAESAQKTAQKPGKLRPKKPTPPTHIKHFSYEVETGSLEIQFQRGGTFIFSAVPEDIYAEFEASGSKWAFFLTQIRNKFRARAKR